MDPAQYLHETRAPMMTLLIEYALDRNVVPRTQCTTAQDLREFLKRVLDGLQNSINSQHFEQEAKNKLSHERRILAFLQEAMNKHAHEHARDTRLLAMAVSTAFKFFLESYNPQNETVSKDRFHTLTEELYESIFSEYISAKNTSKTTDLLDSRFESLHDKLDRIIEQNSPREPQLQQRSAIPDRNLRQRLEHLRSEIEKTARERGYEMQGFQHLIQYRRLDNLIMTAPKNVVELQSWAKTLASYEKNKRLIDRQVVRWGPDIVAILGANE